MTSAERLARTSKRSDQDKSIGGQRAAMLAINETLGFVLPAALRAAASVAVADHLVDGPRSASDLAALTGTHAPSLYRVLRLLSTHGFFQEDTEGRFTLTTYGDVLRTDAPFSVRDAVLMLTDRTVWEPSGDMTHCIVHGSSAFTSHFGMSIFEYVAQDESTAAAFHAGIASMTAPENEPVARCLDIPNSATVVDIGGGYGGLLVKVLRAWPNARGLLYEHAHALAGHILETDETTGRWEVAEGDFFTEVPPGDIYLLKRIMHDWQDEECIRILSNCRRSLISGGQIFIADAVIPPGNTPHQAKTIDLLMMASYVGRERTEEEFSELLERTGFRLVDIVPTSTALSVIKAVPV